MRKYIFYFSIFILGGIVFLLGSFFILKYKMKHSQEDAISNKIDVQEDGASEVLNMDFHTNVNSNDLNIEFESITTGDKIKLKNKNGKLIIINQWATWCIPCLKEFPYFSKLMSDLKSSAVEFYFISNENVEVLKKFNENKKLNIPIYNTNFRSSDSNSMFFTDYIPVTLIISPDQDFYFRSKGSSKWYSPQIKELILKLSS